LDSRRGDTRGSGCKEGEVVDEMRLSKPDSEREERAYRHQQAFDIEMRLRERHWASSKLEYCTQRRFLGYSVWLAGELSYQIHKPFPPHSLALYTRAWNTSYTDLLRGNSSLRTRPVLSSNIVRVLHRLIQ
jgi:hypothetical protein